MTTRPITHAASHNIQLVHRDRSCLLIVDVQEKLLPAIADGDRVLESIVFLLDCASVLNLPVLVSEQYPQGLGPSVPAIAEHQVAAPTFQKLRFSAKGGFEQQTVVDLQPRRQVVIVGIETHICVLQTALEMLAAGYQVFVVEDGTGSRHIPDRSSGLARILKAGGIVCTAESVAFEWCAVAGTEEFRKISRLVRDRDAKRR